ncbi:hypothetical protein [Thermoflexus sp.]|uniref:hypothetical protein n=1 Tax=Thermoflexus sp. TaxID=1969742 RepID=UPI0035E44C15
MGPGAFTEFTTLTSGAGAQVFLPYRPEGAFSLADLGDRLQQELTRVGLSIAATMVAEDHIGIIVQEGRLGNRSVSGGTIEIQLDSVGVMLFP